MDKNQINSINNINHQLKSDINHFPQQQKEDLDVENQMDIEDDLSLIHI